MAALPNPKEAQALEEGRARMEDHSPLWFCTALAEAPPAWLMAMMARMPAPLQQRVQARSNSPMDVGDVHTWSLLATYFLL